MQHGLAEALADQLRLMISRLQDRLCLIPHAYRCQSTDKRQTDRKRLYSGDACVVVQTIGSRAQRVHRVLSVITLHCSTLTAAVKPSSCCAFVSVFGMLRSLLCNWR